MPDTLTAPADDLTKIARLRDLAPEIQAVLDGISQKAANPFLVAHLDGYRRRLLALADETTQLLQWIEPDRPAPPPVKKAEVGAEVQRRAKLAATRLKQRQEVAELQATMADNRAAGFPTDASQKTLDRMRADRLKTFGEDNYVFGLAASHCLEAKQWHELADAYRALAAEATAWTRRTTPADEADRTRIEGLQARFAQAILPCGHALSHDVDADWLGTLIPAKKGEVDGLATMDDFLKAIPAARAAPSSQPTPIAPTNADRCRLKAEVARTKARLARAEAREKRDDDATLDLRKLQAQHRVDFHEDGYVFGFSNAHRLEPDAWEDLARAYEDLADAIDRGIEAEADAQKGQEAIDRLRAAMLPAGRGLRHDDDADDLEEEIRQRHPRHADDPLAPFAARLGAVPEDAAGVAALAESILAAGVRPSDPRLREPFLDWADDLDAPALEPLVRELRLEQQRRQEQEDEQEPATPDPDYLSMRDRVREVTRGKRLLMVGGLNREDTRRAIEAELDLKELHWPNSDEHKTKPGAFDVHVEHADIVVKNRFCRRGYQRALERAKAQGKPAIALLGGYNARQVVRGIAEALRL